MLNQDYCGFCGHPLELCQGFRGCEQEQEKEEDRRIKMNCPQCGKAIESFEDDHILPQLDCATGEIFVPEYRGNERDDRFLWPEDYSCATLSEIVECENVIQ